MGKGSIYHVAKGDLLLQSKHADVAFTGEEGLAAFWFNTPTKGKCLSVEYNRGNWPALYIVIQANWRARRQLARFRRKGALWIEGSF